MSTNTLNLTGEKGKIFGILAYESGQGWRIASEAEPTFQRTFPSQQDAFYFWYSSFDPKTGKLRG